MWIEWVGDEVDHSRGAIANWACGCTGEVEWRRVAATNFTYCVRTPGAIIRGTVVMQGSFTREAGLQEAMRAAEAAHEAHHGED